jgi:hypothetical protein
VGVVRDPSDALVAEASVTIVSKETGAVRKTSSDPEGEYTATNLAPGHYEVTVDKEGFSSVREPDLLLQMDQVARFDVRLKLGSTTQSVAVVEALEPLLNTENGTKGEVMSGREMIEMPLNGRNTGDLGLLVAGITPNTTNLQGSQFAINGARPDNTNFIIDGFSARDPLFGGPVSSPNLDSMQEFKMQTNSFSAEYGRMAGGVMNMVLKSGTNDLHGALFEFLRNDALDTRNSFDARKSELRLNQFGGLLGGPIWIPKIYNGRNRTFFFMSWESLRQVQGSPALGVVATTAQRSGDFSAGAPIADPLSTGTCPRSGGIGACFPGNVIPPSRLSSAALAAQHYYPLPNASGVNNMSSYAVAPTAWYRTDYRRLVSGTDSDGKRRA